MDKEYEILDSFIRFRGLRHTPQRDVILRVFLSAEGHLSVEELHALAKKHDRSIGYTTVYRTMKLLSESGLADKVEFGDGIPRYEHKYNHRHHDHFVCVKCGKCFEVAHAGIEKLQETLARERDFTPLWHTMQVFGLCKDCRG
jgi:Fur family ferric uptake transcriptional regulator